MTATRESPRTQVGASPRGSLALLQLARGRGGARGRDYVTPDDVKAIAVPALATAWCCGPSCGCSASAARTSCANAWPRCRRRPRRTGPAVKARPTARLGAYAGLAALGLLAALALGRPELAALAAPFAALAALGALEGGDPELSCRVELERERVLEGDEVEAVVYVATHAAIERLELALVLPPGLHPTGPAAWSLRLAAGEQRELRVGLRPRRWGGWRVGDVSAISAGVLGMVRREGRFSGDCPLRAYPREETLRRLIAPADTQPAAGSRIARVTADGVELAEVRPYVHGDSLRRINWRASARRDTLIVSDRHPERSADVVILLDTFSDEGGEHSGTLAAGVRAAAALTRAHSRRASASGWSASAACCAGSSRAAASARLAHRRGAARHGGRAQLRLEGRRPAAAPHDPVALDGAGVTPLLDTRMAAALLDLRARGHDVAVVELAVAAPPAPEGDVGELALRLWLLQRDALRASLAAAGVGVSRIEGEAGLAAAVEGVTAFRRRGRLALR